MVLSILLTCLYVFVIGPVVLGFIRELLWHKQVDVWVDKREDFFKAILTQLHTVTSVPQHKLTRAAGGNLAYQGTLLNYTTLSEMAMLMVEMESERQVASNRINYLIKELTLWEHNHSVPTPPTYFGRRWRLAGLERRVEDEWIYESPQPRATDDPVPTETGSMGTSALPPAQDTSP